MKIIIRNLIKPHKLLLKIIRKINFYIQKKKYKKQFFENHQDIIFKEINLSRNHGLQKLKEIKHKVDHNSERTMSSEHEALFASISVNSNYTIKNILEIGTFDGVNSLMLSLLFKETIIDTIDLDENDENFYNFYNRKNVIDKFINNRDMMIAKNKNINFKKMNSVKLIACKKKYDLIWIDGAHGYPVVCIDIINSLNLINDNGLIICDDIITDLDYLNSDKMYRSIAAYETIDQLKKVNLINFELIYKRLSAEHNSTKNSRKYIAIIKKNEKINF